MDIRKVKKLIELLDESDIAEIEIHEGEESVRISRISHALPPVSMPPAIMQPAVARFQRPQPLRQHPMQKLMNCQPGTK